MTEVRNPVTLTLDQIVETLPQQWQLLQDGEIPREVVLSIPRVNSGPDKKTKVASKAAIRLFPPEDPEADPMDKKYRVHSYIQYNQQLAQVRNRYKEHRNALKEAERKSQYHYDRFRAVRLVGEEDLFFEMIDEGPGEPVLNPTPMPVMVPPLDDFKPFFCHMKNKNPLPENQIKFKRGVFYADGRIDLCKQVVGPTWIGQLMEAIVNNDLITHFLMGNNVVGPQGAQAIGEFIKTYQPPIETWYLAGNKIGPNDIKLITDPLKTDVHAKALWLKRNPLMAEGVKHVADMLVENQSIEILDLNNVGMMDEGCTYLFDKLRHNTTLKMLYMDANNLTWKSCKAIGEYMKYMNANNLQGLHSIFMGMNPLKNRGALLLANGLTLCPQLQRLCVSSCRITSQGLVYLVVCLMKCVNLIHLDVGHYKATSDMMELPNCFLKEGGALLGNFAKEHPSLQILDCRTCHIPQEGLALLAQGVAQSQSLLYCYAEQYGLRTPESRAHLKTIREANEANCQKLLNINLQNYCSNRLRFTKHTERVQHIDSIYRNSM
jgi:Ran GTPase-activating protein (RanGAP) involved in mRNA processing and transport